MHPCSKADSRQALRRDTFAPARLAADRAACAPGLRGWLLRWLLRWLTAALLALVAWTAQGQTPRLDAQGVLHVERAQQIASPAPAFPADGTLRAVNLPATWKGGSEGGPGPVWYRIEFDAPPRPPGAAVDGLAADPTLALLMERACGRLVVVLNDVRLQVDGPEVDPSGAVCFQPRLLPLPGAVLRAQANRLDIRIAGLPLSQTTARQRAAGLWPVQIGPYTVLASRHEDQRLWQVTAVQVMALTLLLLGAFVTAMGWHDRRDGSFVFFGLLALGWGLVTLRTASFGNWRLGPESQWLFTSLIAPVAGVAAVFLLRSARWRDRRVDALLLAQCVLMPVSLLLVPREATFGTALFWYTLLGLELMAAGALLGRQVRHQTPEDFGWTGSMLAIGGLLVMVVMATQYGWLPLHTEQVAHLAMSALLLFAAFHLVRTFASALRSAEAARLTMELRVAEATAQIERNFAQLAELRVEQVTEKERKRIAADLHDDLGAKLLTIVHTSESERIANLAREALEEMRLSVRGLTGKPVQVADALADWRAETVARLGQAGIDADWRGPADEVQQRLPARTYVQTTRILREAVSNIIKHSGATHCKVRCGIGADEFVLLIQDNGRGISTEMSGKLDRGQGMYSMKNRAKQMHGQCLVESGPGFGTVIRLTLPLRESSPAAPSTS